MVLPSSTPSGPQPVHAWAKRILQKDSSFVRSMFGGWLSKAERDVMIMHRNRWVIAFVGLAAILTATVLIRGLHADSHEVR